MNIMATPPADLSLTFLASFMELLDILIKGTRGVENMRWLAHSYWEYFSPMCDHWATN